MEHNKEQTFSCAVSSIGICNLKYERCAHRLANTNGSRWMIANISNQKLQLVTSIQILIRQQVDDRQHIQSSNMSKSANIANHDIDVCWFAALTRTHCTVNTVVTRQCAHAATAASCAERGPATATSNMSKSANIANHDIDVCWFAASTRTHCTVNTVVTRHCAHAATAASCVERGPATAPSNMSKSANNANHDIDVCWFAALTRTHCTVLSLIHI